MNFVVIFLFTLVGVLAYFQHNIFSWLDHRDLEKKYEATLVRRATELMKHFDPKAAVKCPKKCELNQTFYGQIDRVSKINRQDFLQNYLYQGKPVIVTDAAQDWPIASMNLSTIAAFMPDSPILPRAVGLVDSTGRPIGHVRGVRMWERFMASRIGELARKREKGERDSFYYSWLNVDEETSLLSRKLYSVPYFLDASEPFIAEWMYIGGTGTGVLPHIDHMCMGKWSLQIRGRKRWHLSPSMPHEMTHLGDLDLIVEPGELLFFLPDHVHGTMCLPSENLSDDDEECLSIHGYIELPFDGNCYLQKMMQLGHAQHQDRARRQNQPDSSATSSSSSSSSRHSELISANQEVVKQNAESATDDALASAAHAGFVRYATAAERARYDMAPSDYFYRCPPSYHHRTVKCESRQSHSTEPILSHQEL